MPLHTGLNTFSPVSLAVHRFDEMVITNGNERGWRYDGLKTSTRSDTGTGLDYLGIDAPSAAPTVTSPAGGAATAGDYLVAYRFTEDRPQLGGVALYSNAAPDSAGFLSPTEVTAAANDKFLWADLSPTLQARVTHVELLRSTANEATTLYRVVKLGAQGTITTISSSAGVSYTVTSAAHGLIAGARVTISGVTGTGNMATDLNAGDLVIASVTTDTFTINDASASGTYTSGGTWKLDGFESDTYSDSTISSSSHAYYLRVPITNNDGSLNLYAHLPPPNYMGYVMMYQDRALYLAPTNYTAGTATFTSGSATVTGSGTAWTQGMVGRYITGNASASGTASTKAYYVSAVGGATSLTISEASAESGAGTYTIKAHPLEYKRLRFSETDRPESVPATNQYTIQENVVDDDEIVGGIPFGSVAFVLFKRHIYEYSFIRQPRIDSNSRLIAFRGAFNKRCWATLEGWAYLMDQDGAYRINSQGVVQPLSGPIQDLWRDGTLDFTRSDYFHVVADRHEETVKFYVCYTNDDAGRPKRWLTYYVRTGGWSCGSGVHNIGHACQAQVSGKMRVLAGGNDDQIYKLGEGTADHVAAAVRATVVAQVGGTQLKVSKAAISSDAWKHASLAIIDGTGYSELRRITANGATDVDGNVTITIDSAWVYGTAAGDIALIGAIQLTALTRSYEFPADDKENKRAFELSWRPTTNDATVRVRWFWDADTTATAFRFLQNLGYGVKVVNGMPAIAYDLKRTRGTTNAGSPGYARWDFPGQLGERGLSHRSVQFELVAYQGLDQIILDALAVEGAE